MNHEPFEELLSAYALGVLRGDDKVLLENHLRAGCQECNRLLIQFNASTEALAHPPVEKRPRPYVKEQIMREIGAAPEKARGRISSPRFLQSAFVMAALFAAILLYPVSPKAPFYAEVMSSQGTLLIDGAPAEAGARVPSGHQVSTAGDSFAYLKVPNVAVFKIKDGARIRFNQDAQGIVIELASGSVFSHVKTGTHYAVDAPLVTAEARGTCFFVKTYSSDKTYLCICKGHLHLTMTSGTQEIEASHHKALDVSLDAGHIKTTPGTLHDHTDEEAKTLGAEFQ